MANQGLSPQVEAMNGRHVKRGTPIRVLDVRVSPGLGQQLHTQGTVVREGRVVERCLALVVQGVDAHLGVGQWAGPRTCMTIQTS